MKYYPCLDGMRAFAVLIVMLAHAGSPYPRSGSVGVDIFFVLSGFLITSVLCSEYRKKDNSINLRKFYARRVLRLAPALIITCVATFTYYAFIKNDLLIRETVISLTYTSNWALALFNINLGPLAHTWSLSIEEQFYLIWPFVILILNRYTNSSIKSALTLLLIFILINWYRYSLVGSVSVKRIHFGLDTHSDGLILGSCLAYLNQFMLEAKSIKFVDSFKKYLSYYVAPLVVFILLVLIYKFTWQEPEMGKFGYLIATTGAALLIFDVTNSSYSLVNRLLNHGALCYLGKISYGLYLYHVLVYTMIDDLITIKSLPALIAIKMTITIIAASISFFFIETWFLKLKRFFA